MIGRALLLALALVAAAPAAAETVTAAVAPARVSISSTFAGVEATIFGAIEADPATPRPRHGYDVVVTLSGPEGAVVVRRKEPVAGLWINRDRELFARVPLYSAIASTRPLEELTDRATLDRLGLDRRIDDVTADARHAAFRLALHRLELRNGNWRDLPGAVTFLGDRLFTARIAVPAEAPVGRWTAAVRVFADGVPVAATVAELSVAKSGFDREIAELAAERPALYGLLAVALSLVTGWLGGFLFRRD
jgi:uncharacterized protein (TIGR02186 family)